jgi:hypothetical protein
MTGTKRFILDKDLTVTLKYGKVPMCGVHILVYDAATKTPYPVYGYIFEVYCDDRYVGTTDLRGEWTGPLPSGLRTIKVTNPEWYPGTGVIEVPYPPCPTPLPTLIIYVTKK